MELYYAQPCEQESESGVTQRNAQWNLNSVASTMGFLLVRNKAGELLLEKKHRPDFWCIDLEIIK